MHSFNVKPPKAPLINEHYPKITLMALTYSEALVESFTIAACHLCCCWKRSTEQACGGQKVHRDLNQAQTEKLPYVMIVSSVACGCPVSNRCHINMT